MNASAAYFDITKLFKVMDANDWTEGKRFMKFWADGEAQVAAVDPSKKKSTIGANVKKGLRIYTIQWSWINKFKSATTKLKEFSTRLNNDAVKKLLISKYGNVKGPHVVTSFNDWLVSGLNPHTYLQYIKKHQLQFIAVNPYDMNGGRFNDLVAALNGFNFFAFYKGIVINAGAYRAAQKNAIQPKKPAKPMARKPNSSIDPLKSIPEKKRQEIKRHLKNPRIKSIVHVTHVGIYAGDIYEFNGSQYLATWNLKKNTVELSKWDYAWGDIRYG